MFRMDKAKDGHRLNISDLVKQRRALEAELYEETIINEKITENLEQIQRQRHEEKKEIKALVKRIQGMEKCRQYSGYHKFGLVTEMKRKKRMVNQFKGIQGKLFDPAEKAAEIESFNEQFSKQLREAPWLPEKRAILDELKKQEEEFDKIQKEIAETGEVIAERTALLEQHKETPFKSFCLALANYSSKTHTFVKSMDNEFEIAIKLEAKMAGLRLRVSRARAARTPTPMIEDRSANTPIPDANRIAEQQPLLGENRTAKEPPESGTAPKRVRFETIASPDSGSTASYPPYPLHKHMHQQQQKEPDVTVSKNGGFGSLSLFTSATPALGGGRAPTKEQQQQQMNPKKAILGGSGRLSSSFLDMNSEPDMNLSKGGGNFLDNLFAAPSGGGANKPTKGQQHQDLTFSKSGGFDNLFASPPPPSGGGRGPTKEQQQPQMNPKKATVDTAKNVGGFSNSFLDMNAEQQEQDVTLSNNGGFLNNLFGTGDGGGTSKEQSFHFAGFGGGEPSKDQSFQFTGFNFGSNDNAEGILSTTINFEKMTTTQVEAIFVFVSASNRDIGQLWIPAKNCGKKCEALSKFKLGQWVIYDCEKQQIIKTIPAGQEPYETEVYDVGNPEGDVFVQVKTPIIYFSDQAYNEIKAYSPKFGAIGSFFKQKNIVMDQLNYAWISYMSLYRDMDFRKLMKAFEADWVVCSTEDGGLNEEQIHQEIAKGHCKFVNGIVVKCEEQFEVVDNEDEGGSPEQNAEGGCSTQSTTNLLPSKYKLKIWTVLQIWTPNLNGGGTPGIAIHRIECEMDKYQQKNLLKIGTLCKMMLAENWSNMMVAVSPIPIELDGINNIVSHGSKIKLEIHRSQFEIDAEEICVPSIIGPINSAHYRQEIPIQKQNLNIFVEFANNQWNLVGFELAQNVKTERPILMGGFGGGRGQFSKFHPTKPVHSINNNSNVGETFLDQTIEKPSKEMEQPKTTLIGGFGRGRGGSTATFSKFRAPKPLLSKSSNSNAGETFPDQTIEETPKMQHPQIRLTGGFGQNARGGRSGASTFRGSSKNLPSTSQRRLSNSTTDSEAIPRAIDTTPPKKLAPFPFYPDRPSPTSNFGHFDFGKFSRPSKENISGVVVSESNSSFFIFTPAYPEKECRLSKERALNVKHGSWIRFDSREYSTDHVGVGKYRIEERPAFPTLPVRKTVQIKLKAFVPQRWMPNTSSFVPVVNTEFVEKVVDSKKLLDETFAGQTVAVVIERGKMKEWPGYTWFITKLDEE